MSERVDKVKNESDLQKLEDIIYPAIKQLLDSKENIEYSDVYNLLFNKDTGFIKNIEDIKNLENLKKIINLLYKNDETNMELLFSKIYPSYIKYYHND